MDLKNKIVGIDISEFQGIIDFDKVKNEVDFIMIRATWGKSHEDKMFRRNVKECIEKDIAFGFYYYSYATNEKEAEDEVKFFLKTIDEFRDYIRYPIAIDMEDSDGYKKEHGALNKEMITKICSIAEAHMKNKGYIGMIYANADYFRNYIDEEKVKDIPKWIAWWNEKANINTDKYKIWQYTSKGKIKGIGTAVDMNISFMDYKRYIQYLNNIVKIQFIKLKTGLNDLSVQYISCNKEGQRIIDNLYHRLYSGVIIPKSKEDLHKVVQTEFNLKDEDITFLNYYLYSEELFLKLYRSLCEVVKND